MRVITGEAKGRRLETPKGELVRPTTEKVKESIFSAIQFEVQGKSFLDLFCGSGQMGIEALSRGAKEAVFVDKSGESIATVKKNLKVTNLSKRATVIQMNSLSFLGSSKPCFDIIFLDPPYAIDNMNRIIEMAVKALNDGGCIICETLKDKKLNDDICGFTISKQYIYGRIMVSIFRKGAKGL